MTGSRSLLSLLSAASLLLNGASAAVDPIVIQVRTRQSPIAHYSD